MNGPLVWRVEKDTAANADFV